jgi:hypothetical protein
MTTDFNLIIGNPGLLFVSSPRSAGNIGRAYVCLNGHPRLLWNLILAYFLDFLAYSDIFSAVGPCDLSIITGLSNDVSHPNRPSRATAKLTLLLPPCS